MADYIRFVIAFIIAFLSFLVSYVLTFILDKIGHLASKTKSTVDDEIIQSLKRPTRIFFILGGLYFAILYIKPGLKIGKVSINEIFIILTILFVAYTLSRIISSILKWYSKEIAQKTKTNLDDQLFPFVRKFVAVLIYLIAAIIILDRLGIEVAPLLAGLGVAGLAVALALQETLSNLFAGMHLLSDKPVRINDFIKLENGDEGFVREIGWRSIRIERLSGDFVIIPNSKFAQSTINNYSLPAKKERVVIPIGIDYSSNIELAEKTMIQAVKNVSKTGKFGKDLISKTFLDNQVVLVIFKSFGEFSLNFDIVYEIEDYSKRGLVTTEINKEILKLFRRNKINIPFPVRTIYMEKD